MLQQTQLLKIDILLLPGIVSFVKFLSCFVLDKAQKLRLLNTKQCVCSYVFDTVFVFSITNSCNWLSGMPKNSIFQFVFKSPKRAFVLFL